MNNRNDLLNKKIKYVFKPYREVFINNTPLEIDNKLIINDDIWTWPKAGKKYSFDWSKLNMPSKIKEFFKGFIFFRFQNIAATSVYSMDFSLLRFIAKNKEFHNLPWKETTIIKVFANNKKLITFKKLYEWCYANQIAGFNKETLLFLEEFKYTIKKSYERIYFRETYIKDSIVNKILEELKKNEQNISQFSLRELQKHIIMRLCWELAPRPSQIYFLNFEDIVVMQNHETKSKYYCLNLPMSKKLGKTENGKRSRRISTILGKELELLIAETKKISSSNALFVGIYDNNKRCACHGINRILLEAFSFVGLGSIDLRHHLAQAFADEGAPVELLAEILGHNTLIASRAYVTTTPKLAQIKTKALGKMPSYNKTMSMLLTGEIIDMPKISNQNWVSGVVGMEYIGSIGICGLQTVCPKNPIYSCYTCKKFQPFKEGLHKEVLKALEDYIQLFLDTGISKNDLKNNRVVIQLSDCISGVRDVIKKINGNA
ncbi:MULTISPECIES: site-specific integrase [Chryseobacterium]|uniref:site-specific integrase n=1 Tax=Chryseobacterium TaxID=59732 RepID=UPI00195D26C1|nr:MULTISPECIES: site-specific integrase [Chryseobacterium]MBM7419714.1 site-specific recombinase XerD [Chryseobacterium sp. JUb44]MDH6209647.1 site-specific recombinase XerD [Chryseobacterium sp. BIGb0186]WSO08400.1 site-specific integrase [Chryseobacterium scophthalmum]